MSASDYLEDALLDHLLGTAAYTVPTNVYVALFTAAPNDAGGGTEVTGGSYARVAHNTWNAGSGRAATNNGTITFTTATGTWGTITHFALFDASSGGNMLFWGALSSSKTVTSGITFRILDTEASVSFTSGVFTTYVAHKLLDHALKTASYTPPSIYVGLYTSSTSDAGGGTEVSGGSYARVAVATWDAASGGATANTGAINFPRATADWGTVTHQALLDASSSGNMLIHGSMTTTRTITNNDDSQFAAGAFNLSLD